MDEPKNFKILEDFKDRDIFKEKEIDKNEFKKMPNYARTPYHGSQTRLGDNLTSILQERDYKVLRDDVHAEKGQWGDQIRRVKVDFFAERRRDFRGKIFKKKSKKPIPLIIIGVILLFLGYLSPPLFLVGLLLLGGAIYLLIKGPFIITYTYMPAAFGVFINGSGEAVVGTKVREVTESGKHTARGKRQIQSTYISADCDLELSAKHEKINSYYAEKLLKDKEKPDFSLFDLIKATIEKKEEISLQDKSKYEKLTKNEKELEKELEKDFQYVKSSLRRFA